MRIALLVGLLASVLAGSSVRAASIDLVAQLAPGETGPVYHWSLRISTAPDSPISAFIVVVTGFDSFEFAPNLNISYVDSLFIDDAFGDGRDGLVFNGLHGGLVVPGGAENQFLGTFSGPYSGVGQVALEDGELDYGGTFYGVPPDYKPYPTTAFTLRVVPEPGIAAQLAGFVAIGALGALRTARRRVA